MKNITKYSLFAACGMIALSQFSCKKAGTETSTENAAAPAADPQIEAVFLDAAPEGAVSVIESRKKAEPGTTITVKGRIAGAMEPFSADYATLVLSDDSLETCEKNPSDSCKTPWDACCVEPKTISASRLTVQVLGEDGRPVGQTLKQVRGLKELDSLVVTGTVAEGSSDENLILNATGIFPKKS
ncbi:MAG: hypothetical protein P1U86_13950 [Verrucomicrobiales bacterium]|nr:hypothetical protein [Verrucomicrobiales bacterium]